MNFYCTNYMMKVAIIGCGYSGLSSIRRCIEFSIECIAFELSGQVGGLWVYTDATGCDEFGLPIQTSLYESLRTNSPKHLLELPDFEFKTKEDTSYPHHTEVRRYLEEFAEYFNLISYIKFYHYVNLVSRSNDQWMVEVRNLAANTTEIYYFDAVMVCNGHTAKPSIPIISGSELFKGLQIHSHDYRRKTIFENRNVLIIGSASSGLEIAYESSLVAKKTYISLHNPREFKHFIIISKPDVSKISEHGVEFVDNSFVSIDVIVYCTGYEYDYPFLNSSCGIYVEDGQIVRKLYKHYINIEHPTMCFIGLFQRVIVSYLFDLQVQAFLKFLTKQIELPSKSEMLEWLNSEDERKKQLEIPKNHYYHLSVGIEECFEDISAYAKLKNIPPVLFKIFNQNEQTYTENFYELRRLYFTILDDHNYIATLKPETMKIAIIGAGAAGLVSARRAIEYNAECTVFEVTNNVGGVWVYRENCDNEDGIQNPLYANLKTNLPVQLMEFPGFAFKPESGLSYVHHEEVRKYLEDFANEYRLYSFIKFHHQVVNISRCDNKWHLTVKNLENSSCEKYIFDGVMICSGHYSKPFIPNILHLDTFKGYLTHSLQYRRNDKYKGKRVLIVGSAASGRDIGLEIAEVATEVILSCGDQSTARCLSETCRIKPRLYSVKGNEAYFIDGTSSIVDAIIFCTGYLYDYEFLDPSCGIEVEDGKIVKPLFKHFISIHYPTMCFLGLLQKTIILPLLDLQAQAFLKILNGYIQLPSKKIMFQLLHEVNTLKLSKDSSKSHYYYLGDEMQNYLEDLARFGEVKPLPPVIYKMYVANQQFLMNDYRNLKKHIFKIIDDDTFEIICMEENIDLKNVRNL